MCETLRLSCIEVEDEFWAQARFNHFIIDPYAWDPSAERSPNEEKQDDLCEELLGNKEWEDETDEYSNAKLNNTLKAQGVNQRARRSFIRATVNKSTEIASKANAEKKKKTKAAMPLVMTSVMSLAGLASR